MVDAMNAARVSGEGNPDIAAVVADSRRAGPGVLFAALAGSHADGAAYIGDALDRGASAILAASLPDPLPPVPVIIARDVHKALGEAADALYRNPSRSLRLVGVTGTNGKTTTAYILRHVLNRCGMRCGMLGTIEYDLGRTVEPAPLTTPDAVRFTKSLAEMRDSGCEAAVVEVSSHALDQERVWPHRFAVGMFTNLTRDHLDYHGDMAAYRDAKRKLFLRLDERALAVVNWTDPASARMAEGCAARVAGYMLDAPDAATAPGEAIRAHIVRCDLSGQLFTVENHALAGEYRTPLVGRHNVENCLGVMMAAHGLGCDVRAIRDAIADFPGVPGRLERIESADGVTAFVDYSHTDGALRSVLSVLRPLVPGKMITVFGCGGDRDKGKRPLMANAAEERSDVVVVTSDNPRTEDALAIIREIMPGFSRLEAVTVEPDRRSAVMEAARMAEPGDAILVAGKGHEDYQVIGTEKIHLDDRELVREAFAKRA